MMEKSQSPSQQQQQVTTPNGVPLQISQEQLQQLQQMQLQQAQFTAIQVKQEFPNPNQMGNSNTITAELKHHQIMDPSQGQMQIIDAPSVSPHQHHHHVPTNSSAMGNSTTTLSTMSPLQAISSGHSDWGHSRLQLIQPSITNQGYLQHLYPPVLMSGNIIHSGLGQQPIQVITTGKPFNNGGPQMITTQNKSMLSNNNGNFSGSYAMPSIPSSQSQALVFSPVNMPQQQTILSTMSAPNNNNNSNNKTSQQDLQKSIQNQKIIQKVNNNNNNQNHQQNNNQNMNVNNQQCVQVSQAMPNTQILSPLQQGNGQPMQITSPWVQGVPHFWTNGIQPQTLLTQNPIIIRGTQADGTQGMFIQQASTHHAIQSQQANQQTIMQCNIPQAPPKPRMQIEMNKQQQQPRTPIILPQNASPNRPGSNVSTQTAQNQNLLNQKTIKRNKQQAVRPALTVMKSDTINQIKTGGHQVQQQQQHSMHQVVTSAGNKMVVVSTGTPGNLQNTGNMQQNINLNTSAEKQIQLQQIKQHQSLIQQQQQQLQQQILQQSPNQLLQQQIAQQQIAQQIHMQQQQQSQQQQTQQHLQTTLQTGIQAGSFITQHHHQHNQFTTHHHQQQREPQQTGLVHQIVVQQQAQQQQQQQQHHQLPQIVSSTNTTSTLQSLNLQAKQINIPSDKQITTINNQQQQTSNISLITQQPSSQNLTPINTVCSQPPIVVSSMPPSSTLSLPVVVSSSSAANPLLSMTTFTTSVLPATSLATGILPISSTNKSTPFNKVTEQNMTPSLIEINHHRTTETPKDSNPPIVMIVKNEFDNKTQSDDSNDSTSEACDENNTTDKQETNNIKEDTTNKTDKNMNADETNTQSEINKTAADDIVTRPGVNIKKCTKYEKELPKAMIKPNVLTHVIEGFIIQEGSEPFSVARTRYLEKDPMEEPPNKKQSLEECTPNATDNNSSTGTCEYCGKKEQKLKLKKKRFCSSSCSREAKFSSSDSGNSFENNSTEEKPKLTDSTSVVTPQQSDKPKLDTEQQHNNNSNNSNSNSSSNNTNNNPEECLLMKWSVADVCEFIRNLPGCNDYAEDFAAQEIDGQALLLLKENHLVNAMGMKLGPALKIVAKVDSMKDGNLDRESQ